MAPRDAMPKAKAAALKALEIDDTFAEAHTALGVATYLFEGNWSGAERELKRAIELNPNSTRAHQMYALYLSHLGRHDGAITEITHAQKLDPLSLDVNTIMGLIFYVARQYDQAIEQLRKTLELDPNYSFAHLTLGWAYIEKGMRQEAVTALQQAITLSGGDIGPKAWLAYAHAVAGRTAEAQKILDECEELSRRREGLASPIARIYLGLGKQDQAFEWLEKACAERDSDMLLLKTGPVFDGLRSHPSFQDLLRRMNFPE